mmetsp:Transcript_55303/g.177299  ORF Transcript_55303/g.177299 Transcript_55303/m.177299 type:complete len:200 (+) Transcript_55303:272-871(+)
MLADELAPVIARLAHGPLHPRAHPLRRVRDELHELRDGDLARAIGIQAVEDDAQGGVRLLEPERRAAHGPELGEADLPGAVLVLLPEDAVPLLAACELGCSLEPDSHLLGRLVHVLLRLELREGVDLLLQRGAPCRACSYAPLALLHQAPPVVGVPLEAGPLRVHSGEAALEPIDLLLQRVDLALLVPVLELLALLHIF